MVMAREAEITFHDDIMVGYRHYNTKGIETAYPFGFGLSYTTFEYESLELSNNQIEQALTVSVTIKNTGEFSGKEVVQLYLSAPGLAIEKPAMELKGFAKTRLLQPGEQQTLTMDLNPKDLASFDTAQSAWVAEAGTYTVKIGASSTDIRLEKNFIAANMIVEKVSKVLVPK